MESKISTLLNRTSDSAPQKCNPVYVADFNRISKAIDARSELTGIKPTPADLVAQVSLRAATMSITSIRRELTSVRAVVGWYLENEAYPEGIDERKWIISSTTEEMEIVYQDLQNTAAKFVELGKELTRLYLTDLLNSDASGNEEDLIHALSGMSLNRGRKGKQDGKTLKAFTSRQLLGLEVALAGNPHANALKTLNTKRLDVRAMLRIFMRSIHLTGMRPIEVYDCRLFMGDQDHIYSSAEYDIIYSNPIEAISRKLILPIETLDPRTFGSIANMITTVQNITRVPPILLIKNAKTTNSNSEIVQTHRAQILDKIDEDDLNVLALAAHLHHFELDRTRRSNIIGSMTRTLQLIAAEVIPERKNGINLYAFRHDFATRARATMHLWEVAALMGHTAKASTYTYGKRNTRKGGKSGSGGWAPIADPTQAQMIREKWGLAPVDPVSPEVQRAIATSAPEAVQEATSSTASEDSSDNEVEGPDM